MDDLMGVEPTYQLFRKQWPLSVRLQVNKWRKVLELNQRIPFEMASV